MTPDPDPRSPHSPPPRRGRSAQSLCLRCYSQTRRGELPGPPGTDRQPGVVAPVPESSEVEPAVLTGLV